MRTRPPSRFARALVRAGCILTLVAGSVLDAQSADAATAAPTPSPAPVGAVVAAASSCSSDATTGCIQGTLRDENANGIKGVTVSISGNGGTASAKSAADGTYVFAVKKSGSYTLTLDKAGLPAGIKAARTSATVNATLGQFEPVLFGITGVPKGTAAQTTGPPSLISQIWGQVSQGLLLGLLLALAAIGYSLIYGTTGLSNFAHAEQVTLGGLLAYVFAVQIGLNLIVASIITIVLCAFSGYLQDRLLWGPLRKRGLGLTQLMVVTIGLSLALEYVFQYFFGATVLPISSAVQLNMGPLGITPYAYMSMGISIVALIAVGLLLQRSRIGRATRAVSDNRALAASSGIDVDRIIRLVWTVSMGLAGLSGILYALVYGGIQWNTGAQLLLLIFAAVTLGGLGTAFGALVGSIVIGLIVQLSSLVLSSDVKYASALLILILVLIFRPQGILGRRERIG